MFVPRWGLSTWQSGMVFVLLCTCSVPRRDVAGFINLLSNYLAILFHFSLLYFICYPGLFSHSHSHSMMSKVFKATSENPIQGDFVKTCRKYLETLGIELSFEEIKNMSKYQFTKLVKMKTIESAFKYLMDKKNQP